MNPWAAFFGGALLAGLVGYQAGVMNEEYRLTRPTKKDREKVKAALRRGETRFDFRKRA